MCVRHYGLKAQKGEADVSLLLFYWQPPDDVLSYLIGKWMQHSHEKPMTQRVSS